MIMCHDHDHLDDQPAEQNSIISMNIMIIMIIAIIAMLLILMIILTISLLRGTATLGSSQS